MCDVCYGGGSFDCDVYSASFIVIIIAICIVVVGAGVVVFIRLRMKKTPKQSSLLDAAGNTKTDNIS
jgi:hypothetical protein